MSSAESPLRDRIIFNVGARRSGTLWLQRIVTAHPEVAEVPGETHLFSHGIAPLHGLFFHGARAQVTPGKLWVERDVLTRATRDFCDSVLAPHLEPGASFLAERTPVHVSHLDLIGEVYPDARVVHIIRDGRDVARSLVAQWWGPETVADAAREWRSSVIAGRTAAGPARYVEVRYEELLADPARQIELLFERLELPASREAVDAAVAEAGELANVHRSKPGVGAGGWQNSFSAEDIEAFDEVAGGLQEELGYARAADAGPRPRSPRNRRRWTSALPARRGRRGEDPTRAVPGVSTSLDLVDQVVAAMQQDGLPETAGALLLPDATFELVSAGTRTESRGEAARDALVAALREDPARAGRALPGEVYVKPSGAAALLSFELDDGERAERIIVVSTREERISALSFHRLPSRQARA